MKDITNQFEDVPEGHKSGFVTVVGRPNVGKSTLLNGLMQQKIAIVTPRPQTTRTRQLGIITEESYQMVLMDTPGIMREPLHKLDEFMRGPADEPVGDADIILWLVDLTTKPQDEDREIAARINKLKVAGQTLLCLNKLDALKPEEVMPRTEAYRALLPEETRWIAFSAKMNAGVDELLETAVSMLPEGPRYYPADQTTDVYIRDIAAEMVREQVMLKLRDEIPYSVAVQVEQFKERENGLTYIEANVFIEREAHKKIIIGKKGAMLRQIGAAARKEIEGLVEGKVFLELRVKVAPKWRRDEKSLRRFGYSEKK